MLSSSILDDLSPLPSESSDEDYCMGDYSSSDSSDEDSRDDYILEDLIDCDAEDENVVVGSDCDRGDHHFNWDLNRNLSPPSVENVENVDATFNIPGAENYSLASLRVVGQESSVVGNEYFNNGQIFSCKDEMKRAFLHYAVKEKFESKTKRSTLHEYVICCKGKDCKLQLRAKSLPNSAYWEVRHFNKTHTCVIDPYDTRLRTTSAKIIGDLMAPKLALNGTTLKPKEIMNEMSQFYGLDCVYAKAWRAKEYAEANVFGPPEKSFQHLLSYFHMLEVMNPGTITAIDTDNDNHFKCGFWCYGSAIEGFKVLRPVLAIDGTHLKGRFKGVLFVSVAMDPNEQSFPVALGIAHKEEISSWSWFLQKLRDCIGCPDGMMLISDQHKAIRKACTIVYPEVPQGLCQLHLGRNINKKSKKESVMSFYHRAATCYTLHEFQKSMDQLQTVNKGIYDSLVKIGVEKWARAKSPRRRFSFLTSNVAESLNNQLRHARQMPITVLIEFVRDMSQRWFYERGELANEITTPFTPWAMDKLNIAYNAAHSMQVKPITPCIFQVKSDRSEETVNLGEKTCTCVFFQTEMIVCAHAVAAIIKSRGNVVADFISPMYSTSALKKAWAGCVFPVGNVESWDVPEAVKNRIVLAPIWRGQAGRPRKKRMLSAGESKRAHRCKLCLKRGHNRRNCPNPTGKIALSIPSKSSGSRKRARRSCTLCRQYGHTKKTCSLRASTSTCTSDLLKDMDLESDSN